MRGNQLPALGARNIDATLEACQSYMMGLHLSLEIQ